MTNNNEKILKELSDQLLGLMSTKAKSEVSFDKENEALVVAIDAGDETGLLIGKKGETLTSIQTILGILLIQKTGEWQRVIVNVGDYREKEEGYLANLAKSTADRARESGQPQNLYNLTPAQRRIIHMALVDEKDITAESEGEGNDRYLVIKAK